MSDTKTRNRKYQNFNFTKIKYVTTKNKMKVGKYLYYNIIQDVWAR